MIGSLDANENLTDLGMSYILGRLLLANSTEKHWHSNIFNFVGRYLSMLPVDPKLGKMLIMGAVFRCIDPVLTVVAGLSARDPFLLPQDKKDVCFNFHFFTLS